MIVKHPTDKWISEAGIEWATSGSGKIRIACGKINDEWQVWALYSGSHDLVPCTKGFGSDEKKARAYANELWKNR